MVTVRWMAAARVSLGMLASASCLPAAAQERAASEVPTMCKAVIGTVMVGKVSCTAALCNTGASQGGFTGLLAQAMNRGAIDGASFSNGVGAQLATALKQTGCFDVLDSVSMEELRKEMEALGKQLAAPKSVDFVVRASITKADLVVEESGFLAYKKTTATSSMTLDTKLVHAKSGAVSEAGSYDATTQRSSSGVSLGIYNSNDDAAKRGTPFSDVAREAIVKAATGITGKILAQAELQRVSGPAPAAPVAAPAAASSAEPAASQATASQ